MSLIRHADPPWVVPLVLAGALAALAHAVVQEAPVRVFLEGPRVQFEPSARHLEPESSPTTLTGHALTHATYTMAARCDVRVYRLKRVSVYAVCFPCMNGKWACPAQVILSERDWLQMHRVDATPDSAQMIQGEAGWNWADEVFVRPTVGLDGVTLRGRELRIAAAIDPASPRPAACVLWHDIRNKSIKWVCDRLGQSHATLGAESLSIFASAASDELGPAVSANENSIGHSDNYKAVVIVVEGGRIRFEPADIRVRVRVEPHPDNRGLTVAAISEGYARSSYEQLEGDASPRTRWITWPDVPAGEYDIVAILARADDSAPQDRAPLSILARGF